MEDGGSFKLQDLNNVLVTQFSKNHSGYSVWNKVEFNNSHFEGILTVRTKEVEN